MSDVYNTEKLQKYWLFYGEYFNGKITLNPKSFAFYVNFCNYDPEQLLFQVNRSYLNSTMSDGTKIELSPESLIQNPESWLYRAMPAIFCQCQWEQTKKNTLISNSSTTHAIKKGFDASKLAFSKCGIEFYKIQKRSLRKLAKYPQALDVK